MGNNLVTWEVSDQVTMFPIFDGEIAGKLLIRNKTLSLSDQKSLRE